MSTPLAALTRPLGALLDRVRSAFRGRDAATVAIAMLVLVTIGTSVGILALGAVFDATVDQQITIDNPDRPSESTCETFGDDSAFADECDEPARIEVDAGGVIQEGTGDYLHYGLIGVPIWWAVFGLALHGGARLAGGSGSVGDSFVVAGWALVGELLRVIAGLAAIWYVLSTATFTGATIETLGPELLAAITTANGPLLVASAVAVAVQWVIVVGGLEAEHDLDRGSAAGVATVFAAVTLLVTAV